MPSSAVALRSEQSLTPAMVSAVWEIAGALDEKRIPAEVPTAVWVEIETAKLRGEGSRQDNVWLRQCLDRLTGVKVSGEYRGDPWGAVILAEWHIVEGGSIARLLIPPAGIHALRSPTTFTKIEANAAHRLTGHGRRLYVILADKKRLGQSHWVFDLAELRSLMGVDENRSYRARFNAFRQTVLDPALAAINAYGTVDVRMTTQKIGRSVRAIRFDWKWKDVRTAADMAAEADESAPDLALEETPVTSISAPLLPSAPEPLSEQEQADAWWDDLTDEEREDLADKVGRFMTNKKGEVLVANGNPVLRRADALALAAFRQAKVLKDRENETD